ncbi:MAG TPA: sigma-70 family RNA polymerase sigma factor [Puia sp.]|nr:sigma-70 family RNA polymerase sigma factor [Puia sp.]
MDNQSLLRSCMSGDRTAQEALYNLYAAEMLGTCLWYARNKEEAEEILQDGFIQVFRFMHQFTGAGSFEGWIRKIMINAALQKYRKKNHLVVVGPLEMTATQMVANPDVFSRLARMDLLKLVQQLPRACRIVFTLHVLEGLKHREIARLLNISEGTSKSNLSDARDRLQRSLRASKKSITG